ncbi:MAG: T9SS type A sorting domain-containing protein [Bacteroidetes bacterium]|nr:T9SS type A sorting domain-containing protein [Bacteroidota bacterium]
MKKIILSFLVLPLASLAQPTINTIVPNYGDSVNIHSFNGPFNMGFQKTGNQNWNFSSEPQVPVSFTAIMSNPATLPHAASFPNANFGQQIKAGGTVMAILYGRITADSIWGMGTRYPGMPALDEDWINPNVSYRFPFNINNIISDISENNLGDIDTSEVKYVAWGSISTPYGSFPNAILVEDSKMSNGSMVLNSYRWVDVATLNNILEVYPDDSSGDWHVFELATSVEQEKLYEKYRFTVYPNPTTTNPSISFTLPSTAMVQAEIIGMTGQKNISFPATQYKQGMHHLPIKINDLAVGSYFVRLLIDNIPMAKQFTILP